MAPKVPIVSDCATLVARKGGGFVKKSQLYGLFAQFECRAGSPRYAIADAMEISPQAVSAWPEKFPPRLVDECLGLSIREFGVEATREVFPDLVPE